jgi:hypothetical protein
MQPVAGRDEKSTSEAESALKTDCTWAMAREPAAMQMTASKQTTSVERVLTHFVTISLIFLGTQEGLVITAKGTNELR